MKFNCLISSVLVILSGCNQSKTDNEVDDYIEVYISTGELQCQDNGLNISVTKNYLLEAGIEVKSESCGHLTQINFASVCGGGTGKLHVFSIKDSDSQRAENIGFNIADSSNDDDYEKLECDT